LGGTRSEAFSVNERGQIVGSSSVAADVAFHGFLYSDGSMTDLNSLVDESGAGYLIHTGTSINNAGQIAAQAFNPNGETRAILLIPRRGVEKAKPHP
jgi:probable HAF family extracellular repeat protein